MSGKAQFRIQYTEKVTYTLREITRGSVKCHYLTTNDLIDDQMKQFVQYIFDLSKMFKYLYFKVIESLFFGVIKKKYFKSFYFIFDVLHAKLQNCQKIGKY